MTRNPRLPLVAWLAAGIGLGLVPAFALAHQPSDSYLRVDATREVLTGAWDIALRDLEIVVGLDSDRDRAITWGELQSRRAAIEALARARLDLLAAGRTCALDFNDLLVDEHGGNGYAVLRFRTDCPGTVAVTVRYALLFDLDPQHRGLLQLEYPDSTATAVFAPDTREQRFEPGAAGTGPALLSYLRLGVIHIWLGFDHILFLLCLLLPAVLRRSHGTWQPVESVGVALWDTVRVVTAFTLAHSMTLALAALEIVTLPARLVEGAIAASIIIAALNNLFPRVRQRRWLVAFGFGLLHGFGFANVLRDLGLDGGAFAVSLLGFNLGVEFGQLCLVVVWLPLSYAWRGSAAYRYVVLYAGSTLIALLGAWWLLQRTSLNWG